MKDKSSERNGVKLTIIIIIVVVVVVAATAAVCNCSSVLITMIKLPTFLSDVHFLPFRLLR
jgi:flagellar basal body-associated protein FliL